VQGEVVGRLERFRIPLGRDRLVELLLVVAADSDSPILVTTDSPGTASTLLNEMPAVVKKVLTLSHGL